VVVKDSFDFDGEASIAELNALLAASLVTPRGIAAFGAAVGFAAQPPILTEIHFASVVEPPAILKTPVTRRLQVGDFGPVFPLAFFIVVAVALAVTARIYAWRRKRHPRESPIVPGDPLPDCGPHTIRVTDPKAGAAIRRQAFYDVLSIGAKSAVSFAEECSGSALMTRSMLPLTSTLQDAVMGSMFTDASALLGPNWATSPLWERSMASPASPPKDKDAPLSADDNDSSPKASSAPRGFFRASAPKPKPQRRI
jgi:hypothetical protein